MAAGQSRWRKAAEKLASLLTPDLKWRGSTGMRAEGRICTSTTGFHDACSALWAAMLLTRLCGPFVSCLLTPECRRSAFAIKHIQKPVNVFQADISVVTDKEPDVSSMLWIFWSWTVRRKKKKELFHK